MRFVTGSVRAAIESPGPDARLTDCRVPLYRGQADAPLVRSTVDPNPLIKAASTLCDCDDVVDLMRRSYQLGWDARGAADKREPKALPENVIPFDRRARVRVPAAEKEA